MFSAPTGSARQKAPSAVLRLGVSSPYPLVYARFAPQSSQSYTEMMSGKALIVVVGPTGSGKSELALTIAEKCSGEVVNCDSLQIYRHFDIGTAKLPLTGRRGIPHHLIDIADPGELFTAGEYARRARPALDGICARGNLPVVTGGTGFYLRALLDGLFAGPSRDEKLRLRLAERERNRAGSLHRILTRLDPQSGKLIHPNDVPKVMRALEVCLVTRRPMSEWFASGRDSLEGFSVLKLGLSPPREALYERLNTRCESMFQNGLIEEVQGILTLGYPESVKPFESHGYRQAIQFLRGELNLKEAIFYAQRNTRHYAKRQWTWFRHDPEVIWLNGFGDSGAVHAAALEEVRRFASPAGR
jgi:tRNA dimethylallyltransferase